MFSLLFFSTRTLALISNVLVCFGWYMRACEVECSLCMHVHFNAEMWIYLEKIFAWDRFAFASSQPFTKRKFRGLFRLNAHHGRTIINVKMISHALLTIFFVFDLTVFTAQFKKVYDNIFPFYAGSAPKIHRSEFIFSTIFSYYYKRIRGLSNCTQMHLLTCRYHSKNIEM